MKWTVRCEELVGWGRVVGVGKAWSTFEVEFIKGEVDRRCEELVSGDGWLSVHRG